MKFNGLAFSVMAIGLSVLGWTRSAHACTNDNDCTTGGTACGSQVCSYATGTPTCVAAGQAVMGMDGWCTVTSNCKCAAQGATCSGTYCTFTTSDAGSAASSGATGTSGAAGTSGAGGTTSGTTAMTGTNSSSGSGPASGGSTTAPASSSSCAMGQPAGTSSPWALGFAVLGTCFAVSRRRRA
jgi:collagen type I alpha